MKAGKWERNKWVGVSMVGKTLAILGFGKVRCWFGCGCGCGCGCSSSLSSSSLTLALPARPHASRRRRPQVGSEVARRAKGLGMAVIAYDPFASPEKAAAVGVSLVGMDEALAKVRRRRWGAGGQDGWRHLMVWGGGWV